MIFYIDMEHSRLAERPGLARSMARHTLDAKCRIEEVSGQRCLLVRFDRFNQNLLKRYDPRAVIIGGHHSMPSDYDPDLVAPVMEFAADPDRPVLGVCGGHQLIARAHGADVQPLVADPESASHFPDLDTFDAATSEPYDTDAGRFGFLPIILDQPGHPLFNGMPPDPVLLHLHYWEVVQPPGGFEAVAHSPGDVLQIMVHRDRPIFGAQAHPEASSAKYPDGGILIRNFLLTDWEAHFSNLHD